MAPPATEGHGPTASVFHRNFAKRAERTQVFKERTLAGGLAVLAALRRDRRGRRIRAASACNLTLLPASELPLGPSCGAGTTR